MDFDMNLVTNFFRNLAELAAFYIPKVLLALLTLIIGLWLISVFVKSMGNVMVKRRVDPGLKPFFRTIVSWGLKILLFVSVASMIGIQTTSFIAVIGAAGLAIGLALQGSLTNFAGGVLILLLKPFSIGDFITAPDYSGTVKEIQIFYTVLLTPLGQKVVIPNGKLSNNSILNYSSYPTRRLDLSFGISYSDDVDVAKSVLRKLVEEDERIHNDPAPVIVVEELRDSSVNIKIKVWTDNGDYWTLIYDVVENGKKELEAAGIVIPFPQRDVHLFKEKE